MIRTSGLYIDCQAWRPAHVFLDGKYLGMMNLREESNKQFAFSNYGIDKEEIDQWKNDIELKAGDKVKLDEWYDLSVQLASNPNDTIAWQKICDIVDIDEYCNYMAAEIYMGNYDWFRTTGFKNLKGFRARADNGKFHLVLHDVDLAFGANDMILQIINNPGAGSFPKRFCNMLMYPKFKQQFIDTYCIINGSVFDPERCYPIIMSIYNTIEPALKQEGCSSKAKIDQLYQRISDNKIRRPALKESLMKAFDLCNEYSVCLSSSISQAKLLLNGQEIPTGYLNGYLFPPITLTSSAPIGNKFIGWCIDGEIIDTDSIFVLSERFEAGQYNITAVYENEGDSLYPPICINEVSSANDIYINDYGKKADWIELYNLSDQDFDLSGTYLSDDKSNPHKYQILPSCEVNTVIPAHGYQIIWCDGKEPISQLHSSFKLKNTDETYLSVSSEDDLWVDTLRYKSQPRWHTFGHYPDGGKNIALFDRPTIAASNRLCTTTFMDTMAEIEDNLSGVSFIDFNKQIMSVKYFNLNGQQIMRPSNERIAIQQIIYEDGTRQSRKVYMQKYSISSELLQMQKDFLE